MISKARIEEIKNYIKTDQPMAMMGACMSTPEIFELALSSFDLREQLEEAMIILKSYANKEIEKYDDMGRRARDYLQKYRGDE